VPACSSPPPLPQLLLPPSCLTAASPLPEPSPTSCLAPQAWLFLGKAAFHLGEREQAEGAYGRAAALSPGAPHALQGLAELHTEGGEWAKAASDFDQLAALAAAAGADAALAAKARTFRLRAADARQRAGQLRSAEAALQALLAETPAGAIRVLCCAHARSLDPPRTPARQIADRASLCLTPRPRPRRFEQRTRSACRWPAAWRTFSWRRTRQSSRRAWRRARRRPPPRRAAR